MNKTLPETNYGLLFNCNSYHWILANKIVVVKVQKTFSFFLFFMCAELIGL